MATGLFRIVEYYKMLPFLKGGLSVSVAVVLIVTMTLLFEVRSLEEPPSTRDFLMLNRSVFMNKLPLQIRVNTELITI